MSNSQSSLEEGLDLIDDPWGHLLKEWVVDGFPSFLFLLVFLDADVFNFFGSFPVDVESMGHFDDVDPVGVSVGDTLDDFSITNTEWFILEFFDGFNDFCGNWDDVVEVIFPLSHLVPAGIFVSEAVADHVISDLLDLASFLVLEHDV